MRSLFLKYKRVTFGDETKIVIIIINFNMRDWKINCRLQHRIPGKHVVLLQIDSLV